jgi:glycosyltransferase involved in cell wall biosynthesis
MVTKQLRILHWGPFPQEHDGGAAVNYWLWRMAHKLMPNYQHFAVPKNPEELIPREMPFMNYLQVEKEEDVPRVMFENQIPVVESFHLPERLDKVTDAIHDVGGKIMLHQTVHWQDDQVFKMKHLTDMDYVIAPTEWARKQLIFIGKVGSDNCIYIPHGVDTEKFYPRQTTAFRKNYKLEDKTVILFNGRYSTWKGLHTLIPLIRPFTEQLNCAFIIRACAFGAEGSLEVRMHELFRRLEARNKNLILLDEWLPYEMMPEIAASADIAVNPSGHEGFNVPNIEGMASGIPVITTDLPNHIEIVGNEAGLFVQATETVGMVNEDKEKCYAGTPVKVPNPNSIAQALKFLVENPEERKIMGEAGRKRVEERYALAYVADAWLRLFEQTTKDYDMKKEMQKRMLTL